MGEGRVVDWVEGMGEGRVAGRVVDWVEDWVEDSVEETVADWVEDWVEETGADWGWEVKHIHRLFPSTHQHTEYTTRHRHPCMPHSLDQHTRHKQRSRTRKRAQARRRSQGTPHQTE